MVETSPKPITGCRNHAIYSIPNQIAYIGGRFTNLITILPTPLLDLITSPRKPPLSNRSLPFCSVARDMPYLIFELHIPHMRW